MSKIRRRRPRFEFVQILNAVARDYRVSWRARGLLVELLSYPPNWEPTVDDLVKQARRQGGAVEGRDAMRKAARELKDVGYIVETRYQDDRGRWVTELEVTDDPMYDLLAGDSVSAGHSDDGFSGVGEPGVGEPGVNKKREKKTEKKILPPTPSEADPSEVGTAGREDEISTDEHEKQQPPQGDTETQEHTDHEGHLERAEALVDRSVRLWPKEHQAPSARDRQRLRERVVDELAAGGDQKVIVHEMSRDLRDAGSAVKVVMGSRTKTPGWGQAQDPRSEHSRHEIRTRTPWCGNGACDEHTRLANVYDPRTGETRPAQCRAPVTDPVTGETVACHPRAIPRRPEPEDAPEAEEMDPDEFAAASYASLRGTDKVHTHADSARDLLAKNKAEKEAREAEEAAAKAAAKKALPGIINAADREKAGRR